MDDNQIIGLYFARSEQAIAETASKYGTFLERIANNILNSKTESEEIVNDAYLGVWKTIPPQHPESLKNFLSRIVRNLSLDRLGRRTAKKRGGNAITSELDQCIPDVYSNVEREFDARELARSIDRFLASLDEQSLTVFVQRYYYSETIPSIAKTLGITERRVKYLLSKCRTGLKSHLQKEGEYI